MKVYYHNDSDGNVALLVLLYFLTGAYGVYKYIKSKFYKVTPEQINLACTHNFEKVVKHNILGVKPDEYDKLELIEMDYSAKAFEAFKNVKGEHIILLDISFKNQDRKLFEDMCKNASFVMWVDHHASSEKFINDNYGSFKKCPANLGTVFNVPGVSAAELTYVYLKSIYDYLDTQPDPTNADFVVAENVISEALAHPTLEAQEMIHKQSTELLRLISDGDTRAATEYAYPKTILIKSVMDYVKIATPLQAKSFFLDKYVPYETEERRKYIPRFRIMDTFSSVTHKVNPDGSFQWFDYLADEDGMFIGKLVERGRVIYSHTQEVNAAKLALYAYEKEWLAYNCIVINEKAKSTLFESVIDKYDMCVTWAYTNGGFVYSLFSVKPNINCQEIAETMGGGGHKGAAGFTKKEPIPELL